MDTIENSNTTQTRNRVKAPSNKNSFQEALLKTALHAFDDLRADHLLESVTHAQITSSEEKQNNHHIPITPEWARSVLEWLPQKKLQDDLGKLIPEKLNIIKTVISIKEPQRKLNEWGLANWIRVNWNLDKADLQILRSIKDSLCGQKVSLAKLIQIHNETSTAKVKDQTPNKPETNKPEPPVTTNSRAEKTRNETNVDGNHNFFLSLIRSLAGPFTFLHPTDHHSQTHTRSSRKLQRLSKMPSIQMSSPLKTFGLTCNSNG